MLRHHLVLPALQGSRLEQHSGQCAPGSAFPVQFITAGCSSRLRRFTA
jgi:hypothetical protein